MISAAPPLAAPGSLPGASFLWQGPGPGEDQRGVDDDELYIIVTLNEQSLPCALFQANPKS